MSDTVLPALPHEALLRRSFEVAREARSRGEHPLGCILVDATGAILLEQGNGYHSEGGDMTAHAERLLASRVKGVFARRTLVLHPLFFGRALCHVRRSALLGRNRAPRLWTKRSEP